MHKWHLAINVRKAAYDFSVHAYVATLTVAYVDIYLCVCMTNPALCKFNDKLVAKSVCCSLRLAPTMIIIILVRLQRYIR